jgi:hypothetical protein
MLYAVLAGLLFQLPEEFWPTSLIGWLTLGGLLAGIVATGWGFGKFLHDLNGFGKRLNECEKAGEAFGARMTKIEQDAGFAALDRTNMREAISRLSTEVQTLAQLLRSSHDQRVEEQGEIRERLVRIETKLDDNRRE